MEVRDYNKQLRGYVLRSETEQPKALTKVQGYCGLHFPYLASPTKRIALVEDIPSSELLSMYTPAAALLGSQITADQIEYILACGIREIVLCLDDDATNKAIKEARKQRLLLSTHVVHCHKDPKDMSHAELDALSTEIESRYEEQV